MSHKQANRYGALALLLTFGLFAIAISANAARQIAIYPKELVPGGDLLRGQIAIEHYGCGSCHTIPGIEGANASVGPPLYEMAERSLIAGNLPNTPDNLVLWIQHPQQIEPGSDMPEMGISEPVARDIAAYLYEVTD